MKPNDDIRAFIRSHGLYRWQVAKEIGIHEKTLICWLRDDPIPEAHKELIFNAVTRLCRNNKTEVINNE